MFGTFQEPTVVKSGRPIRKTFAKYDKDVNGGPTGKYMHVGDLSAVQGGSEPATTAKHYADLASGATKEVPAILERYVSESSAARNANPVQTNGPVEEQAETARS